jgi:hypothetical protein
LHQPLQLALLDGGLGDLLQFFLDLRELLLFFGPAHAEPRGRGEPGGEAGGLGLLRRFWRVSEGGGRGGSMEQGRGKKAEETRKRKARKEEEGREKRRGKRGGGKKKEERKRKREEGHKGTSGTHFFPKKKYSRASSFGKVQVSFQVTKDEADTSPEEFKQRRQDNN